MSGQDITIHGSDGDFSGYLAKPKSGTGPGVVVIQEIFGVNAVMRGIADDLAAKGYVALAPDLFWRIERNVQITDKTEAEWKKAFDFYQKFNVDSGVKDIQSTIAHLRKTSGVTGKVGAVGYCLGGLLAYLTSTRTNIDASVSFYGVGIEGKLNEASNIKKPTLLHIAAKDQFVPPAAQAQIVEGLKQRTHATVHVYPGVDHAFARIGGQHYDKSAADLANSRTAEFFQTHLQ
jgi:carboxymethylenebutenolidase